MEKHPTTASTVQVRLPNGQHAVPLTWAPGPGTLLTLQSLLAQAQCPQAWEPSGLQSLADLEPALGQQRAVVSSLVVLPVPGTHRQRHRVSSAKGWHLHPVPSQ